ncbi:MAG: hypothetical protein ACYTHM_18995 [Planctomycetota bacterium]
MFLFYLKQVVFENLIFGFRLLLRPFDKGMTFQAPTVSRKLRLDAVVPQTFCTAAEVGTVSSAFSVSEFIPSRRGTLP